MVGRRKQQGDLYDVGLFEDVPLDPRTFHGQLARISRTLFSDEEFAALYHDRLGRPSAPPSQLALLLILQQEAGVSDREAITRSTFDARWCAVLGTFLGKPPCAKSTLQLFRTHLILHNQVRLVFLRSVEQAREAGLLPSRALRLAVDTKPILGRGAVEDTYNLVVSAMQRLMRALARRERKPVETWARRHDFGRYFPGKNSSVKGSADLDWSDLEARQQFLTELVTDARRLWRVAEEELGSLAEGDGRSIREAQELLGQILLQDVKERPGPGGRPEAELKEGTAKDRVPSAHDPEQRHGHKSKSKLFNGHKAAVAVDTESQIIVGAAVLAGNAGDASGLLEQVERVEQETGLPVEQTLGDCAHGSGGTRQEFAEAGRTLLAKVPQEAPNRGYFQKSAFVIDLEAQTVTCPEGHEIETHRKTKEGGRVFRFGLLCASCPLRPHCTPSAKGRTVHVHPQEALLQAARGFQASPEGRAALRERMAAEHRLARLAQLRIGQARYRGRKKTEFQLLLAAAVANFRWLWNWQDRQRRGPSPEPRPPACDPSPSEVPGTTRTDGRATLGGSGSTEKLASEAGASSLQGSWGRTGLRTAQSWNLGVQTALCPE